eukprot:scaffold1221_cov207-Amphora_coffeaeformis.AAC.25
MNGDGMLAWNQFGKVLPLSTKICHLGILLREQPCGKCSIGPPRFISQLAIGILPVSKIRSTCFGEATSFNQDLCFWQSSLNSNYIGDMFVLPGCLMTRIDPNY